MEYPVTLTPEDGGYVVSFPDVPGAITEGNSKEEALGRAVDALLTVFDALIKDRREIPVPSRRAGAHVQIPALESAKIELYRSMRAAKVSKSELGRRLNVHLPQIDRLFDVRHASQLRQIEDAFTALGQRLEVNVVRPRVAAHANAGRRPQRANRSPSSRNRSVGR